jgi:hypothetical protein
MTDSITTFEQGCLAGVAEKVCEGETLSFDVPGFQYLIDLIVKQGAFAIDLVMWSLEQNGGESLSFEQEKAVTALRCGLTQGGNNLWHYLAAAYYVAKEFADDAQMKELKGYWDDYYPLVCTCNVQIEDIKSDLGFLVEGASAVMDSACTEAALKQALKAQQDKEIYDTFTKELKDDTATYGYSNSTDYRTSNVTFTATQAKAFTKDVFDEFGWDSSKMVDATFTTEFNALKQTDGKMNMTMLVPLVEKMIEKDGDKMQDQSYYSK